MEQLLKLLEDNARLPIEDIATMLNKSPAEVAAMIDLARAQGIIKGYKTLVAVSYTHLDVYKRQTMPAAAWRWMTSPSSPALRAIKIGRAHV